ncbi:MAG TPA: 3-deoxy-manno-octulosonate cytidylyltransferase [Burkholderiales bacterium]|nr:3-deoxy-manno-octulosonate cytidylyltransferase [Burkholderiales bacterium]
MHVIIPARYASTRLPGKPLADIAGKPMIQHVYERARESGAQSVTVATDDARIRAACEQFGAQVVMTAESHRSGTERLAEAIRQLGLSPDQIVVNVQGDEPLMPPAIIRRTAEVLSAHADAVVATVCCPIHDDVELRNSNVVKVVRDAQGYALYFSRAPIPFSRDGRRVPACRHIGLYAYRAGYIAHYLQLEPSPYEQAEQLEQLRVLWHGGRIALWETDQAPPTGVDSAEDLERVRKLLKS